jgi:hypothetical protein
VNRKSFVVGSGSGAALCLLCECNGCSSVFVFECNGSLFCVCYTNVIGAVFCDTIVFCDVMLVYDSNLC